jgi:hypothetical protein
VGGAGGSVLFLQEINRSIRRTLAKPGLSEYYGQSGFSAETAYSGREGVKPTLRMCITGLLGLAALTGGGCGRMNDTGLAQPAFKLQCAAALPAQAAADADQPLTAAEEKTLRQEAEVLDKVLQEYFAGRNDIKMISSEQAGKAVGSRQALERAKKVAEQSSCNAVLETAAHRYKERVGGEYAAEEPASAAFSWRLLSMPDGAVLCHGRFDEEQQPLFNNLLNFRRSAENSFTWVTAERLLSQNLREQLADCRHLQ